MTNHFLLVYRAYSVNLGHPVSATIATIPRECHDNKGFKKGVLFILIFPLAFICL